MRRVLLAQQQDRGPSSGLDAESEDLDRLHAVTLPTAGAEPLAWIVCHADNRVALPLAGDDTRHRTEWDLRLVLSESASTAAIRNMADGPERPEVTGVRTVRST